MKATWVIPALLVFTACEAKPSVGQSTSDAGTPMQTVEVVPVTFQILDTVTSLEGELSAFEDVAVRPRASGFVNRVLVDRGSVVKAGQVVLTIDAPELAAQRAEVEARVQVEESTLKRLTAAAATPGAVAGHEVELAKATVDADTARLRSLRVQESYLTVTAPFDGLVTERNIHPGALVGPQAERAVAMLRIQQVAKLRLTVAVPESWAGAISEGAEARFWVRAFPGEPFTGVVRRVSHSIDSKTRAMPVELDVENASGRLAPGMFATVQWPVHRTAATAFVPPSAIIQSTERTFVARVRDGAIEQVVVARGAPFKDSVEVFGDLNEGDVVVRRGSDELRTGMKVRVMGKVQ